MASVIASFVVVGVVVPTAAGAPQRLGRPVSGRSALPGVLAVPRGTMHAHLSVVGAAARSMVEPRFSISRSDGNDVPGPLDLRSMKISRGKSRDTVWMSAFGAVSNSAIDPKNGNFTILIDTNDDQKYEYGLYVFYAGHVRGVLVDLKTNHAIAGEPTSRVGGGGFKTQIPHAKIGNPGTYRFAVFGYYQSSPCSKHHPCVDAIPNRYPLIPLDYAPPSTHWGTVPEFSTDASATLTSPVTFSVKDNTHGTGVKGWTLERRMVGSGKWRAYKSGKGKHAFVNVEGKEGQSFDLRVVVTDKQKNKKVGSVKRTTFPYDDQNPAIAYSSSTPGTAPAAFLGTISTVGFSGTDTTTFTLTADASKLCVLGGPTGSALHADIDATINGLSPVSFQETDTTTLRQQILCYNNLASGDVLVLTPNVSSTDGFVLDGIAVKP